MASDPLLHIKDSYYFDVPKTFWRPNHQSPTELADNVGEWTIRNDADYQDWEADLFIARLKDVVSDTQALANAKSAWLKWQHASPKRHGRPFDQYVEDSVQQLHATAAKWAKNKETDEPAKTYLSERPDAQLQWMLNLSEDATQLSEWTKIREEMDSRDVLNEYIESSRGQWSTEKVEEYNSHLSGKVFIPQPFATLRDAYETQSGAGITRYMVIEVAVALIILALFSWLAGRVKGGDAPRGKAWNFLECFLTFLKVDVVEKGIDPHDSPRYLPLLWTVFLFILGCNLMGMLPWVGSPTASLAVTAVLALLIFVVGTFVGVQKFGVAGYLKNLCPELGLPMYMAVVVVPMVWLIEFFSLFIKHAILAIRLLANMAAGHLVLLGLMALAFGTHAYTMHVGAWSALSVIVILGTTLLSFMELFVAFLQAYVFTLLASLFIGAATHHH